MYSPTEVCEILKISKTTFYLWRKQGKINVMQVTKNGAIRISKEEIERIKGVSNG